MPESAPPTMIWPLCRTTPAHAVTHFFSGVGALYLGDDVAQRGEPDDIRLPAHMASGWPRRSWWPLRIDADAFSAISASGVHQLPTKICSVSPGRDEDLIKGFLRFPYGAGRGNRRFQLARSGPRRRAPRWLLPWAAGSSAVRALNWLP